MCIRDRSRNGRSAAPRRADSRRASVVTILPLVPLNLTMPSRQVPNALQVTPVTLSRQVADVAARDIQPGVTDPLGPAPLA